MLCCVANSDCSLTPQHARRNRALDLEVEFYSLLPHLPMRESIPSPFTRVKQTQSSCSLGRSWWLNPLGLSPRATAQLQLILPRTEISPCHLTRCIPCHHYTMPCSARVKVNLEGNFNLILSQHSMPSLAEVKVHLKGNFNSILSQHDMPRQQGLSQRWTWE